MTALTDASGPDLGAYLRPGDHIVWGQACGEPTTLVEALISQAESIGDLSAFAATSFSGTVERGGCGKVQPLQHGRHRRAAHGGRGREARHRALSRESDRADDRAGSDRLRRCLRAGQSARRGRQSQLRSDRRFRSGGRREGTRGHRRGERARALHAGRCGAAGGAHRLRGARRAHSGRGSSGADRRERSTHRPDRDRLHRGRRGDSGRRRRGTRRDPAIAGRSTRSRRAFGHDRRWPRRSGRGGRGHQRAQAHRCGRVHHRCAHRHAASL